MKKSNISVVRGGIQLYSKIECYFSDNPNKAVHGYFTDFDNSILNNDVLTIQFDNGKSYDVIINRLGTIGQGGPNDVHFIELRR